MSESRKGKSKKDPNFTFYKNSKGLENKAAAKSSNSKLGSLIIYLFQNLFQNWLMLAKKRVRKITTLFGRNLQNFDPFDACLFSTIHKN